MRMNEQCQITQWRADTATSIILETKPRYEPVAIENHNEVPAYGPYSRLAILYKNKLINLTGSHELSEKTISIYWELRNLFRLKEGGCVLSDRRRYELKTFHLPDTTDQLERRVVPLTQLESLSKPNQTRWIYTLFGYAALAHIYLFMHDCSKDLLFSHMLLSRMWVVLGKVDMQRLENKYPEMML